MLWHALRGLPKKEEGGSLDSNDAREVKGYLLGQVEFANKRRVVTIKEVVQLPFNDQDAGDAAYFNAQDRAILEKKLRSRPSVQLVGNYHSHPNHEIKLSDQDVVYLSQYLPESYHVAAIVGPREPAVGFFLRNEQGAYTPWQEPIGRTRYTRANDSDSGFAWKPDIEVVDEGGGNVIYVQGKRTSRKGVWWATLLAAVALGTAAFLFFQRSSPVMGVIPTDVSLTSSGEQSKTIELKLDRKGDFTFIVPTEDFPSWLEITPTKGDLGADAPSVLSISANMRELVSNKPETHTFNIISSPAKGGTGNTVPVTVTATKDLEVITSESTWELPPLRAEQNRFIVTLPAEPSGDGTEVVVRGFSEERGSWVEKWSKSNPPRVFDVAPTEFGPMLSWNGVRVEAKATRTTRNPSKVLNEEFVGTVELKKAAPSRTWMRAETKSGKVTMSLTRPLPSAAEILYIAQRGSKAESTLVTLKPGDRKTHTVTVGKDLRAVGATAAYVGDGGVYELRFTQAITAPKAETKDASTTSSSVVAVVPDDAFDRSQGPLGQQYRTKDPLIFKQANLKLLGEFGGPKNIQDIPSEQRAWRLTIQGGNKSVHESWGPLIRAGQLAERGQMAWDYDIHNKVVNLYFVFAATDWPAAIDWLLQQDTMRMHLQPAIEKCSDCLNVIKGPDYRSRKQYPVAPAPVQ